jgi:hypothetical protein
MDHHSGLKITIPKRSMESPRPHSAQSSHYLQVTYPSPHDSLTTLVNIPPEPQSISVWEPNTPELEKESTKSAARSSRTVLVIESTILVIAATTLGLASAYGVQLMKAPRQSDIIPSSFMIPMEASLNNTSLYTRAAVGMPTSNLYDRTPSNGWIIREFVFNDTMPVLSIIFAIVGACLAFRKSITPIYSTIISAAFLSGWCVNLGWWLTCDWATTTIGNNAPGSEYITFSIFL